MHTHTQCEMDEERMNKLYINIPIIAIIVLSVVSSLKAKRGSISSPHIIICMPLQGPPQYIVLCCMNNPNNHACCLVVRLSILNLN